MKDAMRTVHVKSDFMQNSLPPERRYERVVIHKKPVALQLAFEWGQPESLPRPQVVFRRTG
jgi:hypothetical protein